MSFFLTFKAVIQILPTLIAAINALEAAFPQGGIGKQKLDALKGMMQVVYDASTDKPMTFEQLWLVIAPLVGVIVSMNKVTSP